jgi:chitodextrinase
MTKKIKKLSALKSDKFNPKVMVVFATAMLVAGLVIILSKAAPAPPTVYLSPSSMVVGPSGTVTVQVRENSGTTAVNAVQANFSYPTSLLTFVSIDGTGSAFGTAAQGTGSAGQVSIARGTSCATGCTTLTGDQLVATVTFTATSANGAAALAFTSGTALVEAASPNADILGGLANTAGGTYTVDAAAPTVNVTAPANNATINGGTTTSITATATDASSSVTKVDFYIDGVLKLSDTTSPYSYSWDTTGVALGAHTIQAKATDTFGNLGSSSVVNVTVADQTAPTVSITAPAASAVVNGSTVAVSANSSDNVGVVGVQFKLDGANLSTEDTTSPYSVTWNSTTATSGTHSLTAVARDAAGNTTTSTAVSVNVDNAAPTVSITAPTAGSNINGTVTVNTTATDNTGGSGIAKVEFYADGVLKSTDTTSPYSFSWDTSTVSLGAHSLTAKAYDKAPTANVTTSTAVSVNVTDGTPPSTPTNLHTTSTTTTSVSLAWTASTDNVGVTGYQVKRNGTTVTTTAALSYTDTGLSPSTSYSYTIVAVDAAGNASTAGGPLSATTLALKIGDLNNDGVVDIFDLSIMLSNWNSTTTPQYDLNANGTVDIFDLSILLTHYGS